VLLTMTNRAVDNSLIGVRTFCLELFKKCSYDMIAAEKSELDSELLIAFKDNIYFYSVDSSVYRFDDFYAAGAGGMLALGSLSSSDLSSGRERLHQALEVACKYCSGCGGPLEILEV